jgi:multiple antibiotic resistance protein
MGAAERRRVALRGTLIGGGVLLAFALIGDRLLGLLGIGLPAFRVAGGLMLLVIAFEMVFERRSERRTRSAEGARADSVHEDVAVFPVAIPLIAGPGAITAVVLLMGRYQGEPLLQTAVLAVLALVLALSLAAFLLVERIERLLGATGTTVASRLLGILLAALAVQFVLDGIALALF